MPTAIRVPSIGNTYHPEALLKPVTPLLFDGDNASMPAARSGLKSPGLESLRPSAKSSKPCSARIDSGGKMLEPSFPGLTGACKG